MNWFHISECRPSDRHFPIQVAWHIDGGECIKRDVESPYEFNLPADCHWRPLEIPDPAPYVSKGVLGQMQGLREIRKVNHSISLNEGSAYLAGFNHAKEEALGRIHFSNSAETAVENIKLLFRKQ